MGVIYESHEDQRVSMGSCDWDMKGTLVAVLGIEDPIEMGPDWDPGLW